MSKEPRSESAVEQDKELKKTARRFAGRPSRRMYVAGIVLLLSWVRGVSWLCWSCNHRRSFADDLPHGSYHSRTGTEYDWYCCGLLLLYRVTWYVPGIVYGSTYYRSVDVIYYTAVLL